MRQAREVIEQFSFGHAARQVLKDVVHRDARPLDAGFAAANGGVDGDAVFEWHESMIQDGVKLVGSRSTYLPYFF